MVFISIHCYDIFQKHCKRRFFLLFFINVKDFLTLRVNFFMNNSLRLEYHRYGNKMFQSIRNCLFAYSVIFNGSIWHCALKSQLLLVKINSTVSFEEISFSLGISWARSILQKHCRTLFLIAHSTGAVLWFPQKMR